MTSDDLATLVERRIGRHVDGHPAMVARPWDAGPAAPGAAYAVVLEGAVALSGGLGVRRLDGEVPDGRTVFRIASMTKSFTAATVLSLRDRGQLDLYRPITDYVPAATGLTALPGGAPSADALMRMAGGLATDDPWGDRLQGLDPEGFDALIARPAIDVGGGGFEYSNYGYALLGRVIEAVTGRSFMDEISATLLEPLGMTATGWAAPDGMATGYVWREGVMETEPVDGPGAFGAMGGLFSTADDVARWVRFMLGELPGADHVLAPSSRAELELGRTRRGAVRPAGAAPHHPVLHAAYGYGLTIAESPTAGRVVWHSGGYPGFGSSMVWAPSWRAGVVVLMNGRYAPATRVALEILHDLVAEGGSAIADPVAHPQFAALVPRVTGMLAGHTTLPSDLPMAGNMELDEPWDARQRRWDRAGELLGGESEAGEVELDSPVAGLWEISGRHGAVEVEVLLTPVEPTEIQVLELTLIPHINETLDIAGRAARAVWKAAAVDPGRARGQWEALSVAAIAGPATGDWAVANGDGETWATWRVPTGTGSWLVSVEVDESGAARCAAVSPG